MKVITVATQSEGYFKFLQESFKRHGEELIVLGWNEPWKGWLWRMQLIQDYLQSLPDDEVVCFIDAYDVILLRPLKDMENLFRRSGSGLIFSCEVQPNLIIKLLNKIVFGGCKEQFVNAGTYIGYVSNIKHMLIQMQLVSDSKDDQIRMNHFCRTFPSLVDIDYDNQYFIVVNNSLQSIVDSDMIISDGNVTYKRMRPFFAHGNGNTYLDDLIMSLGYDMTEEEREVIHRYNQTSVVKKVLYYTDLCFRQYLSWFFIIVIIVLFLKLFL